LICPEMDCDGIALFRFAQVASIRDLWRLISSGCDSRLVQRSLHRLARWSPEAGQGIADLQRFGRRLVMRTSEGGLVDANGQRLFVFDDPPAQPSLPWRDAAGKEDSQLAFERAVELESDPAEAIVAYENWLDRFGPDAAVCFNLANLLTAAGSPQSALPHYRQASHLRPEDAFNWNNFALALAELGRFDEASEMLARAIHCDPDYADAYYNAADILDLRGQNSQAKLMWLRYLQLEPAGEHARFARSRCEPSSSGAAFPG
jgi:tetratricopeptide (TPR) repeat protein